VPGHILRFDVRYAQIKEHLQRGAIGQVVSIFSRRTRPQSQFAHHGANHTAFVTMPHDIDLALWWAGSRVTSVRAHQRFVSKQRRVVQSDAPDLVWATLQFENGIIAVLHASWLSPDAAHIEMADNAEVIGETGLLQAQTADSGFSWWSDEPASAGRHAPDLGIHHRLAGHTGGALRAQLAYLTNCIRSEQAPNYTSFEDAIHGVEIAEAIVRSALSGTDVLL
jgi:predicted dehydrogenase